jgi:hypothetical protein
MPGLCAGGSPANYPGTLAGTFPSWSSVRATTRVRHFQVGLRKTQDVERDLARAEQRWRHVGAVVLGLAILSFALIPGYSGFFGSPDTNCGAPLHEAAWGTPGCSGGLQLRLAIMGVVVLAAVVVTALGLRRRSA